MRYRYVNIPEELLNIIDEFVRTGQYASIAEFVREALREHIRRKMAEHGKGEVQGAP